MPFSFAIAFLSQEIILGLVPLSEKYPAYRAKDLLSGEVALATIAMQIETITSTIIMEM